MSVFETALAVLASPYLPSFLRRGLVRGAVRMLRRQVAEADLRQKTGLPPAAPAPETPVYVVDGYHGGTVFWDWLILPGGGLWYLYNWPLCLDTVLERSRREPGLKAVFELDAHTYEEMSLKDPGALAKVREAVREGRVEIVNGTYAQPLAALTSGEAFVRQLELGREVLRKTLGTEAKVFFSQEPSYFPQLPQILAGFGYEGAVLRTQWAAFGTDPAADAEIILWESPDGTAVRTVPRYGFQSYDRLRAEHPGLANMALSAGPKPDWAPESIGPFARAAAERGIARPLVTDLKDTNFPDAPLPCGLALARLKNVHYVTLTEYFGAAPAEGPRVRYGPDDFPATLPWGLQGEMLLGRLARAEGRLHTAERADAAALLASGETSPEAERDLKEAWKALALAQHHDIHVCGPWHSRRHGKCMAEVGLDFAGAAERLADRVTGEALRRLEACLGESGGGDILVFNPSPWTRRDYVEVTVPAGLVPTGGALALTTPDERVPVPAQIVRADRQAVTLGFVADLPSLGYKVFRLETAEPHQVTDGAGPTGPLEVEITVHPDGTFDLSAGGLRLVTAGGFFTVQRDGREHDSRRGVEGVELAEDGPVFRRYLVRGRVADIPFRERLTLYRRLPRLDLEVTFTFGEKGVLLGPQPADDRPGRAMAVQDDLKLGVVFPSPLGLASADGPFLVAETSRSNITGLFWAGLETGPGEGAADGVVVVPAGPSGGAGGGGVGPAAGCVRGVAFLNRGTRGYFFDRARGRLLNVLAWAPESWTYASDDSITRGRSRYTALRGSRTFECAVFPYASRVQAEKAALDFQSPPAAGVTGRAVQATSAVASRRPADGAGRGAAPRSRSFLAVGPEEVVVTAVFVRDGRVYARLWNVSDREVAARLRLGAAATRVRPVSLDLEREEVSLDGPFRLGSWGIRTVRLEPAAGCGGRASPATE